jgi:predicted kinase
MSEKTRELVILVGMQGSGKTYYCKSELPGHERISQDEGPRRYPGVLRRLQELLRDGAPRIVIDRTNPMRRQRQEFVAVARAAGYRVKIVYLDIPEEKCRERIRTRRGHPTLAEDQMRVAIARYLSTLDLPTSEECDELIVRRN